MDAYLYYNKSDKRYLEKTLESITYDNGSDHIDVEFKEDSSIIDPTFVLRTQSKVLEGNYIYVPDLNRYYYINDYTVSHQRIYINCHVDVLMSFKKEIKNETIIVKRQEYKFNMYNDDSQFKVQNRTAVETIEFPSGFNSSKHIVMGVVGKKQEEGE